MAIPASPIWDRPGQSSVAGGSTVRRRSLVVEWLAHPQASFFLVLAPAVLLLGLGTLMVLSASSVYAEVRFDDAYYFLKRHIVFLVLGGLAAWVLATSSPQRLKIVGWITLVGAFGAQLATFTSLGWAKNGNKNWVDLGVLGRIQPSEFAKLAIVLWGADVLARKHKLLDQPRHLIVPFVPVSVLLIGLVVLQRDLGTGMVLGAIVLAVLWYVGASWKVLGSMVAVVGAAVGALVITNGHRMDRILGFLNPDADPLGVNHQPIRALMALASGGWWGLGLGASRQKWGGLVESHTDYVLAVIGEELGLVGTLAVLALFLVLGYAGFRIAMRSDILFCRFAAGGVTSWLMIQALVNIMVVLRMVPVLGVPLPLLSYGGSALIANLCAIGILLACARQEPAARALAGRRKRRRALQVSAVVPGRRG
ncbi:MAG: putative lipid II flippase FtsW [Propionicimonas sp.]|nr:putative lipid II flippase FtsW [Propionicimonas sp.]MEA5116170.1 putative lipid II flippase FtsW [Propionicimonas sp.]